MDALVRSARRKESSLVVGLDPDPMRLPPEVRTSGSSEAGSVLKFCTGILEAVEDEAAAIKLQSAYFERLGPAGAEVYSEVISAARALELPIIADVKRGDIGSVAAAYAEAHLRVYRADCVTVNPYMGEDAVSPFLEQTRQIGNGGGVFVLVATSNPSARHMQMSGEPPLFERSASLVAVLGERQDSGYLDAGAVVGATRPEIGRKVRELLPDALFLVPGYGAQGGDASSVPALLGERGGVLVNSSRAVIYAGESSNLDYREAAREAARRAKLELREVGARV